MMNDGNIVTSVAYTLNYEIKLSNVKSFQHHMLLLVYSKLPQIKVQVEQKSALTT